MLSKAEAAEVSSMSKRTKVFLIIFVVLLRPMKVHCGQIFYGCVTPGLDSQYYAYGEVEPLNITLAESLINKNLWIYYGYGDDTHSMK